MQTHAEFGAMCPRHWSVQSFDEWTDTLRSICGRFNPARDDGNRVRGCARLHGAGGLELAHVANDVHTIRRDLADIRADYGEHLFLLMQLEGTCGVEQSGRQSVIAPGDCILVDSSCPSLFYFGGRFSNHISVHLPRQLIIADRTTRVEVSRRLAADDPMAVMLRALVAKLLVTDIGDHRAPHLRELLFSTTRQAFAADDKAGLPLPADCAGERLEIVQVLIDRHLTDECLSPQWLADRLGVSLRTLQEDFSVLGTTATELIRTRRLHLVRSQLEQMKDTPHTPTIAEIAYSAGFNDISYFNRCFRKLFACSPKDVLHQ